MAKRASRPKGFREVQAPFVGPDQGLASLFADYGFACAFTGADLRAEAEADARGYVVAIGDNPATTDPTRLIPASLDAIHAFERGHLTLGLDYNFLVDLERISPEFLETLNPIGRLRLPASAAGRPSQQALAAHRDAFVAGTLSRD
jgi:hypothetical protein